MTMAATTAVLWAEWTKIRTISSSMWTLTAAFFSTIGLGALLSVILGGEFDTLGAAEQAAFDPVMTSFIGMGLGQLAMITFGVLVVTSEYGTGMIRTTLAAVPQRGLLYGAKAAAAAVPGLAVGMATSVATFFVGQALLGEHGASLGDPGVLRAVTGAGVYLTLMLLFAVGVATMLRKAVLSLSVLMAYFFMIAPIFNFVPATRKVGYFFPDQAGTSVMQVVQQADGPPYGPWVGLGIMALWAAASLAGGYFALKRNDA
ncbi:ABC transporter permease [Streptomyces sp. NPDC059874]|uniref:ABC transporter permease n=1 Tax=Streptomyces sp. NPDC059874 TaxID=3346983 RepID=UPI0036652080